MTFLTVTNEINPALVPLMWLDVALDVDRTASLYNYSNGDKTNGFPSLEYEHRTNTKCIIDIIKCLQYFL